MKTRFLALCALLCFVAGLVFTSITLGEDGVAPDSILLGTTGNLKKSLTHPEETLGVKLYLKYINDLGGVHGRMVRFVEHDDQNDAEIRKKNLDRLIKDDKVFAIHVIGGTPASILTMKYAMKHKVLFTFPHQGSSALAGKRYIFTSYPFYDKENDMMMKYLVETRKFKRVGLIYADNAYGRIFVEGLKRNCKKYGLEVLTAEPLKDRNPKDVNSPLTRLRDQKAQALIMALYVKQAGIVLKERKNMGWDDVTLVSTGPLTDEKFLAVGGGLGEGVIGLSLYPDPLRSKKPAIVEFRQILEKYYPGHSPNRYNFYGYLYTKLFVEGLKRAGKNLTRDSFIEAMESIKDWESGVIPPVSFSADDHHAQESGYIVELKNGVFQPITDWIQVK